MKKFLIAVVLSLISYTMAFTVDFMDEQVSNSVMLGLRIRVNSEVNYSLKNVKLRYVFRKELEKDIVLDTGYTASANVSLNLLNDTLGYVEISIDSILQGIFPNTSGFSLGLHYSDWSLLNKSLHPSYIRTSNFVQNANILLYYGDSLVYGNINVLPKSTPNFKIVGFQAEGNSWLDIQNISSRGAFMNDISIMGSDGVAFSLDSIYLDSMDVLRICKNDSACGSVKNKLKIINFGWGKIGEALLMKNSVPISYVPWGNEGLFAQVAVNANVWSSSKDFFESAIDEFYFPIQYTKNIFYRIKPNTNGTNINDWFSFSNSDNSGIIAVAPNPIKLTMNKPNYNRISIKDSINFSWLPIQDSSKYKFIIRNSQKQVIYEKITGENSIKVQLPDGSYSWSVVYEANLSKRDSSLENNNFFEFIILTKEVNGNIKVVLPVEPIKARKDTKLLNLGYMKKLAEQGWDRSHVSETVMDSLEKNRCWLVSAQVINHYYGGNVTQDEIAWAVRFDKNEPLHSPFISSGGRYNSTIGINETMDALKFALNTHNITRHEGTPSYATIKNEIDNNRLVLVEYSYDYNGLRQGHAMVIHGYIGDSDNYAFLYAFGDNNASFSNSTLMNDSLDCYYTIDEIPNNVAMTDYRVHYDSDGDGVMNFDEEERFGTDPFNNDTDGDGIDDKMEIFNYASKNGWCSNCSNLQKIVHFSDKNLNGIRAELDSDENANGIIDGLEGSDSILHMNVPNEYTLFARDHLIINDGVECYDSELESNGFCSVASTGRQKYTYNSSKITFSLGARAHVGNVKTYVYNTNSILRNSAHVYGNMELYGKNPISALGTDACISIEPNLIRQQNSSIEGNVICKEYGLWREFYQCELTDLSSIQYSGAKIVAAGEYFVLNNSAAYKTLKVENGGTLVIAPGEIYIDSLLQIEPNANIEFASPGKASILHINGSINWKVNPTISLTNSAYWVNIARGFKLIQHSSHKMFIEGAFAGTIYAPLSKLVIGQTTKIIYGRFFAKDIIVHQYAKIYRVDYNPIVDPSYVFYRR